MLTLYAVVMLAVWKAQSIQRLCWGSVHVENWPEQVGLGSQSHTGSPTGEDVKETLLSVMKKVQIHLHEYNFVTISRFAVRLCWKKCLGQAKSPMQSHNIL